MRAAWEPGVTVLAVAGGTVLYDEGTALGPPCGGRTVRVHPLAELAALPALLPGGGIECVGVGGDALPLGPALRARGVARVCPLGRMQRPPLTWPRGQLAPLGVLLGRAEPPHLLVES